MKRLIPAAIVASLCAASIVAQIQKPAEKSAEQSTEAYRFFIVSDPLAVYANGKWVEVSEKKEYQPAFSGVVKIKCSKAEMLCYDMEALVTEGRPSIVLTEMNVLKWNAAEIIADEEDSDICSRHTLTISFHTRAVTMVDSPKIPMPPSCTKLFGEDVKRANTFSLVATEWPDIGDAKKP